MVSCLNFIGRSHVSQGDEIHSDYTRAPSGSNNSFLLCRLDAPVLRLMGGWCVRVRARLCSAL